MVNIFAYTGNEHFYPPYISLNEPSANEIVLSVRGVYDEKSQSNSFASAPIPKDKLLEMAREILKRYG